MTDPREVEALALWADERAQMHLASARRQGDMDAYTNAARDRDTAARYEACATALRALVAENARLASIIRECVYDGTEGGECEECGEPIRLDQTWRCDPGDPHLQRHTPTCEDACAQADDIVAIPRRERDALTAQLAAALPDVERLDWLEKAAFIPVYVDCNPSGTPCYLTWEHHERSVCGESLRAAIDAAKGGA